MYPNQATFRSLHLGLFLTASCVTREIPEETIHQRENHAVNCSSQRDPGAGPLLAVGGGGTPRGVIREALARVERRTGHAGTVIVVPYASRQDGRGVASAAMWLEEGAFSAEVAPNDGAAAAELFEDADVIWMGGGDQGRLLDDLERLDLVDDIQQAHRRGALVGGTSAGAAVLGSVCIAGSPDPDAYVVGAMAGRKGLGLRPDTIIDQHFRERRREGRLLTAVLDAGGLVGFGVSESTGLFFEDDHIDVYGAGVVIVFDARAADLPSPGLTAGPTWTTDHVRTAILSPIRNAPEAP